ncbi:MAG TPA: spore germination protein GerW family protein [Thermoanaerobaculia bacterium]|nr:spore germination protein GerW family protein [Thermoanaerobaculia bacterium]
MSHPSDFADEEITSGLHDLFTGLAEKLGGTARASAVFGEPVQHRGVTVIPVARARWGVGGGGGHKPGKDRQGAGGGGGAIVSPVGFIEIRESGARYRPILDPKLFLGILSLASSLLFLWVRSKRHA